MVDAIGNAIATRPGREAGSPVMCGSHRTGPSARPLARDLPGDRVAGRPTDLLRLQHAVHYAPGPFQDVLAGFHNQLLYMRISAQRGVKEHR